MTAMNKIIVLTFITLMGLNSAHESETVAEKNNANLSQIDHSCGFGFDEEDDNDDPIGFKYSTCDVPAQCGGAWQLFVRQTASLYFSYNSRGPPLFLNE